MPFSDPADPFAIKGAFDRLVGYSRPTDLARAWLAAGRAARKVWMPLPGERTPLPSEVLPPAVDVPGRPLDGQTVGLVVSGGSGNMISAVGALRAVEEAGGRVVSVAGCSGGALWAAMVGLGWSADTIVRRSLADLDPSHYLAPSPIGTAWTALRRGRAWAGPIRSERVRVLFDGFAEGRRLGELPIAFHTVAWEVEDNRLRLIGSETTPDWTLGEAVAASVSLSPVVEPFEKDGRTYLDGGVLHVFPARAIVEHGPEVDRVVGVNGFLPRGLNGHDLSGWRDHRDGLLRVARQLQMAPFIELARRDWALVGDRGVLVEPIEDQQAYGVSFFAAMIDRSLWPARVRAGHKAARQALLAL